MQAYACIHKHLYSGLYYYVISMVRDEMIAKDLVQDLFIRLWEKRLTIGPIANVKVYFFRTARSLTINHIKSTKVKSLSPAIMSVLDDFYDSPEDVMVEQEANRELSEQMRRAMRGLPERQREMLKLKYYDGCDYDQIAMMTGIRYQSVVNHVHRAICKLREELSHCGGPERSFALGVVHYAV